LIPIVFIPGLLCSTEIFAPQVAALWPYGPVMVASTLEGATMAEMAAAILAAAPARFALAGISMGGYVCFEIMRQAPERVVKLALIDTTARPDTPEQTANRRALVAKARAGDFERVAVRALTALLHPARLGDPVLRATNARMARAVGLEGFARQQEAILARVDSRPSLVAIKVPTLIVVGEQDPVTPPDRAEEMARGIAGSRVVVVAECGHCSTLEQPGAVNEALMEWVVA
jgi:pimeloyl-ACP methyl ester carboxylesterase